MAALSGSVTDKVTGKPINGAVVKLGTNTTTTGRLGSYKFRNLKPGKYPFQVSAKGYQTVNI